MPKSRRLKYKWYDYCLLLYFSIRPQKSLPSSFFFHKRSPSRAKHETLEASQSLELKSDENLMKADECFLNSFDGEKNFHRNISCIATNPGNLTGSEKKERLKQAYLRAQKLRPKVQLQYSILQRTAIHLPEP